MSDFAELIRPASPDCSRSIFSGESHFAICYVDVFLDMSVAWIMDGEFRLCAYVDELCMLVMFLCVLDLHIVYFHHNFRLKAYE